MSTVPETLYCVSFEDFSEDGALAAEMLYGKFDEDIQKLENLKKRVIEGVRRMENIRVNGLIPGKETGEGTAPHVVSVSFRGVRSEVLLHALEERNIYVSAGSACSAHKPQPSATLKAMGVEKDLLESTIRFSFSVFTSMEEIEYTVSVLGEIVPMMRRYTRKR